VTGITILIIYLVSRFWHWGVLSTLLEDLDPHAFTKEELALPSHDTQNNATQWIPKIIHQVYLGFDNKVMPQEWEETRQRCIEMHPDYEYILWTNETSRELLTNEYSWFLETYDNYRYPISRADSIRYFILEHYGGIYIDLDNGCKRKLDPLLFFPAWMPGTTTELGLTNHVMGSMRKHPYFTLLIQSLQRYNYNWVLPYMTIMNSAGPHFVSMVWEHYIHQSVTQPCVRILMQSEYLGHAWSFFTKQQGGTWNYWDTILFKWVSYHMVTFIVICFVCLCLAVTGIWWLGCKMGERMARRQIKLNDYGLPLWQKSD